MRSTRPDDFHRQLIRVVAELSDAAGAFLVRAGYTTRRVAGSGSASRCNGDQNHAAERAVVHVAGHRSRPGWRAVRCANALRRCHEGTPVVCRSVSELVSTDVAPSTTRPLKSWRPFF